MLVLKDVLGTGHGVETVGDSDAPSFARPCHTVDAWQTFSGNLPISLISPSGRQRRRPPYHYRLWDCNRHPSFFDNLHVLLRERVQSCSSQLSRRA